MLVSKWPRESVEAILPVVVAPPVLAAVEVGIEDPAAYFAHNLMAGAVSTNSLARLEVAEGRAVDAEPYRSQEGNRAAIEITLADVERGDATVLAGGDLLLSSQLHDVKGDVGEALWWSIRLIARGCGSVIARQQTGLQLEEVSCVFSVLGWYRNRDLRAGAEDIARGRCLNRNSVASHFECGPNQVGVGRRRRFVYDHPLRLLTGSHAHEPYHWYPGSARL